jgi:SNF2 family DNA or RNA helicase
VDRLTDTLPLLEHQRGDIEWIHRVQRGLLGNEPGLGKTRSAIEAFDGGKNLVIAPNLIVESGTWEDELNRWSKYPEKWTVATYSMLNARKDFRTEKEIEQGKPHKYRPVNVLRPEWKGKWDAVVVDEAHYVKGRTTTWTWATERISRSSQSLLLMTGTPIPNWAHELFMLLRLINPAEAHPGKELGSFWRWAEQWFDTEPTKYSNGQPVAGEMKDCTPRCFMRPSYDPCEHYVAFTEANLGWHFRRMLRDDCLDLPPLTSHDIKVPMATNQRRIYKELVKDFMAQVGDQEVMAWSQGALNVMLDKVTVSPWFLTKQGRPRGGKLEQLRFDLETRSRPTLVLAHHRDVVEACAAVARDLGATATTVYGGQGRKRQGEAVRRFKDGKIDVLCGSLETLSEGLQLQVADMAIFVERSYKPSRNEQATRRIHRMGQERPVTILRYLTPDSVDMRKEKLLLTKTDRQMRVLTGADFKALL